MNPGRTRHTMAWRLAVGAIVYGIVLLGVLFVVFQMTWAGSESDDLALAILLIVTTASSGWIGWYSRSAWSVLLTAPAAWLLVDATAPCVPEIHQTWVCTPTKPEAAMALAIVMCLIVGWASGYVIARQQLQSQRAAG